MRLENFIKKSKNFTQCPNCENNGFDVDKKALCVRKELASDFSFYEIAIDCERCERTYEVTFYPDKDVNSYKV